MQHRPVGKRPAIGRNHRRRREQQPFQVLLRKILGQRPTQIGTARAGSPARARVLDQFGQTHLVMVEPHDPSAELAADEEVLLVRRDGNTFYAERRDNPLLSL